MTEKKDIENFGYRESLDGLPAELLKTLSITKTKPIDKDLIDIIKSFNGVATLDEIMIRRYRQTNEVPDRQYLNNRLLNLVKRKMLVKVPKTKAVYSLPEYSQPEAQSATPSVKAPATVSISETHPNRFIPATKPNEEDDVPF